MWYVPGELGSAPPPRESPLCVRECKKNGLRNATIFVAGLRFPPSEAVLNTQNGRVAWCGLLRYCSRVSTTLSPFVRHTPDLTLILWVVHYLVEERSDVVASLLSSPLRQPLTRVPTMDITACNPLDLDGGALRVGWDDGRARVERVVGVYSKEDLQDVSHIKIGKSWCVYSSPPGTK